MLPKVAEDRSNMVVVQGRIRGEHQNVVKVYDKKLVSAVPKSVTLEILEDEWSIG